MKKIKDLKFMQIECSPNLFSVSNINGKSVRNVGDWTYLSKSEDDLIGRLAELFVKYWKGKNYKIKIEEFDL